MTSIRFSPNCRLLPLALGVLVFPACWFRADGQVIAWGNNSYGQTNPPANLTNVIAMAAGDSHCLALRSDGTVVTWGGNYAALKNVPPGLTNVVAVAAGSTHSLALRSDGSLAFWGLIYGSGVTNIPAAATNVTTIAQGPGAEHVLVLRADGTVLDWGSSSPYGLSNIPLYARNIVGVASASFHGIAVRSDGHVVQWGDTTNVPSSATNIVAVAAGWYGDAGLRSDGTVLVWGQMNPLPARSPFTNVTALACPFSAFFGPSDLLALRRDGTLAEQTTKLPGYPTNAISVITAGSSDGYMAVCSGPPVFAGLPVNRCVAAGSRAYFTAAAAGSMPISYQWRWNGTNIPGATNTILTLTNVQTAQAGSLFTLIASNAYGMATNGPMALDVPASEIYLQANTLAAVLDQAVAFSGSVVGQGPFSYQWQFDGTNVMGATNSSFNLPLAHLTDGGTYSLIVSNLYGPATNSLVLSVVPTIITNFPANLTVCIDGTATFNLGLEDDIPVAYQWQFDGTNLDGETNATLAVPNVDYPDAGKYSVIFTDAYETVTNSANLSVTPVAIWGDFSENTVPQGLTNLIAIAAGTQHDLALRGDGTIIGWGNNAAGESVEPAGLSNVIAISAGNYGSLALKSDGTILAWGEGQYGQTNVPAGLSHVVAISAGSWHNMALRSDGIVFVWGNDEYGQTNVPADLSNVVAIAAGEWNCMALKSDGTVVAWGAGTIDSGADPNFGQSIVPFGLSNVVQITTGSLDDFALRSDGSIVGWGENNGELNVPAGLTNIAAIAGGYGFTAALTGDGHVTVWGLNQEGETNVPEGLGHVTAISSGSSFHVLALIGHGPPPPKALAISPVWSPGRFQVSIPSQSGRVYALEYKVSLSDGTWTPLPLVAGNGSNLTLTDSTAPNAGRFYRVRQW